MIGDTIFVIPTNFESRITRDCVFSHEALGREFVVVARLTLKEVTEGKPKFRK